MGYAAKVWFITNWAHERTSFATYFSNCNVKHLYVNIWINVYAKLGPRNKQVKKYMHIIWKEKEDNLLQVKNKTLHVNINKVKAAIRNNTTVNVALPEHRGNNAVNVLQCNHSFSFTYEKSCLTAYYHHWETEWLDRWHQCKALYMIFCKIVQQNYRGKHRGKRKKNKEKWRRKKEKRKKLRKIKRKRKNERRKKKKKDKMRGGKK